MKIFLIFIVFRLKKICKTNITLYDYYINNLSITSITLEKLIFIYAKNAENLFLCIDKLFVYDFQFSKRF